MQTVDSIPFDEALADVVVLSWNDLMPEPSSGLIHIEFRMLARDERHECRI